MAKVLVIDDDEATLTIVRKMVETMEGFTVDTAPSASEGMTRLSQSGYDAILCDMWMPGMTGKEFFEQLETAMPEYKSRIIFLTGDIASEATWNFIEDRNLPYVLKPINHHDLIRKLKEMVKVETRAPAKTGAELRRGRRVPIKANARVRRRWGGEDDEIAPVANASREGIFFLTGRAYRVGSELLVSFPYTGTSDIEQKGYVVRVEERGKGQRGVAIALGSAAEAVGAVIGSMDAERAGGSVIQDLAGWKPTTQHEADTAAQLKLQIRQARQEAGSLGTELAELKAAHTRLTGQPGSAAASAEHSPELRDLIATKDALVAALEDLKRQVAALREQVAVAQASKSKKGVA